jgi:hypothetical protein
MLAEVWKVASRQTQGLEIDDARVRWRRAKHSIEEAKESLSLALLRDQDLPIMLQGSDRLLSTTRIGMHMKGFSWSISLFDPQQSWFLVSYGALQGGQGKHFEFEAPPQGVLMID